GLPEEGADSAGKAPPVPSHCLLRLLMDGARMAQSRFDIGDALGPLVITGGGQVALAGGPRAGAQQGQDAPQQRLPHRHILFVLLHDDRPAPPAVLAEGNLLLRAADRLPVWKFGVETVAL